MKITYDAEADAAYITIGADIGYGESEEQISFIDTPNGQTQVTIDVDKDGYILGFEVLAASLGLRSDVLKNAIQL